MTLETKGKISQKIDKFSFINQYSTRYIRTSNIGELSDIRNSRLEELVIDNEYWYNCNDYVDLDYSLLVWS